VFCEVESWTVDSEQAEVFAFISCVLPPQLGTLGTWRHTDIDPRMRCTARDAGTLKLCAS
jgi:hypothetical protein